MAPSTRSQSARKAARDDIQRRLDRMIRLQERRLDPIKTPPSLPTRDLLSERICALPPELYNEILEYTISASRSRFDQLRSFKSKAAPYFDWAKPNISLHDLTVSRLMHHLIVIMESTQANTTVPISVFQEMRKIFMIHTIAMRTFLGTLYPQGQTLLAASAIFRVFLLAHVCYVKQAQTSSNTASWLDRLPEFRDARFCCSPRSSSIAFDQPLPAFLHITCKDGVAGRDKMNGW